MVRGRPNQSCHSQAPSRAASVSGPQLLALQSVFGAPDSQLWYGMELFRSHRLGTPMIEVTSDDRKTRGMGLIGPQPIALAAGALVLILLGVGGIGLWAALTRAAPR